MSESLERIIPPDSVLIPANAECVFKGVIFDVYQWQQTMFDGSQQTFEMLRRPDSVAVIVVRGDDILLTHDEQPHRPAAIALPGGMCDKAEAWQAAAQRELLEETGYSCQSWTMINVVKPQNKIEWFGVTFVATDIISQVSQRLDAGGEKISLEWRPYTDIRHKVLTGEISSLAYMTDIFRSYTTAQALLQATAYSGKTVSL